MHGDDDLATIINNTSQAGGSADRGDVTMQCVNGESAMKPTNYSEGVYVSRIPQADKSWRVSGCDLMAVNRSKNCVETRRTLQPTRYLTTIVCYRGRGMKHFRSCAHYAHKQKITNYSETFYMLPRIAVTIYETMIDYCVTKSRKRYTSSVSYEAQ